VGVTSRDVEALNAQVSNWAFVAAKAVTAMDARTCPFNFISGKWEILSSVIHPANHLRVRIYKNFLNKNSNPLTSSQIKDYIPS
jgi:hypothetical protein